MTCITYRDIYLSESDLLFLNARGAMFSEETIKSILTLWNNFLFRKSFFDFFNKMQLDGIEAARTFWDSNPHKDIFPHNASDIFEKMSNFYIDLGLVSKKKYDELLNEHEKLQFVNTVLRETIMRLQVNIFVESGERVWEAWKCFNDIQRAMNPEIAKNFSNIFMQSSVRFYGGEAARPSNTIENRHEIRHTCNFPVEFVLNDAADKTLKGVILNRSDSGLCINSSIPLTKGQKIIIKGSIPMQHPAFTVQWSSALMTGLAA